MIAYRYIDENKGGRVVTIFEGIVEIFLKEDGHCHGLIGGGNNTFPFDFNCGREMRPRMVDGLYIPMFELSVINNLPEPKRGDSVVFLLMIKNKELVAGVWSFLNFYEQVLRDCERLKKT
ncbi:MAG: hypothetical protein AAB906_01700 [Patescibacteria group bacterium]